MDGRRGQRRNERGEKKLKKKSGGSKRRMKSWLDVWSRWVSEHR